jgi:hypothetical protein
MAPSRAAKDLALSRWRKYPVKRHDPEELGFGRFAVPTAIGIGASKLLIPKHLHRLGLGERGVAFALQIDVVVPLRALKDHSIC